MSPPLSPDHPFLNLTLGALLVGCFAAVLLFGVFCQQCFTFFHRCTKDETPRALKCSVAVIWMLGCTKMFMMMYTLIIMNIGASLQLPVTTTSCIATAATADTIVRGLYMYRLWILSEKRWGLQVVPITLSLGIAGLITYLCIELQRTETLNFPPILHLVYLTDLVVTIFTDSYVAVGICIFVWRLRTNALSLTTRYLLSTVLKYTINTGLITCVGWLVCLITHVTMPDDYVSFGVFITMSDLYNVCLLASLNAREWLRTTHAHPLVLPMSRMHIQPSDLEQATTINRSHLDIMYDASAGTRFEQSLKSCQSSTVCL